MAGFVSLILAFFGAVIYLCLEYGHDHDLRK